MKKRLHISTALLLCFSILLGYTGVPLYKMVCEKEGGHVVVSLVDPKTDCDHGHKESKSCCMPVKQQQDEKTCCDYSAAYLHLEEITPVQEIQNATGHTLTANPLFFAEPVQVFPNACIAAFTAVQVPPLLAHKQPLQSLVQVFRI